MATRHVFVGVASKSAQNLLKLISFIGIPKCESTYFNFNNEISAGAIFRVPKKMAEVVQKESTAFAMQSREFTTLQQAVDFMIESLCM